MSVCVFSGHLQAGGCQCGLGAHEEGADGLQARRAGQLFTCWHLRPPQTCCHFAMQRILEFAIISSPIKGYLAFAETAPERVLAQVNPRDPDLHKKLAHCEKEVKRIRFEEAVAAPVSAPANRFWRSQV